VDGDIGRVTEARPPPESGPGASRADPLLASKLFVPPPASTLVDRPRLLARLAEGLRRPLTLIAAPPGWGKTTLLSAWAAAAPAPALAWVSLDVRDNDPTRFWGYVILALQRARPGVGDTSLALLRSHQPASAEAVLTPLLNELATLATDSVLVLDDYHAIDTAAIHHGLTFVIEHLPPQLHLFLATRADPPLPLARWRARGALLEVRADDLRFTREEAERFLTELIRLPLTPEMVAALEARTEGWIAGLQLAALAMRDRRELASFVEAFSGSHRFIADYLVEEVFLRQSATVQDFLRRTSILDRMCASLCQALDEPDGARDSQRQLEQLDRANLFLIPLDGERRWYRYHHLFADLLRARLQQERPDLVRGLHRRASGWFERSGLLEEAIQHALKAEDFARAADLLEPIADPLWMDGQMATLRGWLAHLPGEVLRSHPRLLIAQAGALFFLESRQIRAIEATLRAAEAALNAGQPARPDVVAPASAEWDRLSGRIAALRALQASWQHDTGRTIALAREALDRLGSDDPIWRLLALTALGMAHALRGEPTAATRPLAEATELAPAAGAGYVALGPQLWLGIAHVVQGKLRDASAWLHRGLAQVSQQGAENLTTANFLVGLGFWVAYEWDDLETAERHLVEGIRLAGRQQWPWVLVDAYATLARIKWTRGEGDATHELLQRMERHAREVEIPWPWMAPRVAASMVQAYLAFGQVERAAEWAARFDMGGPADLESIVEFQRLTAARLGVARGQPGPALAELDRLVPGAETHGRWGRVIEIQALRAVALEALGRREDALAALRRALALAEPEGYVRRFVDEGPPMQALLTAALHRGVAPTYVERLLRAFNEGDGGRGTADTARTASLSPVPRSLSPPLAPPARENSAPPPAFEPLSTREREVLRLLVAGRSGPEVAEALVVAHSTVRTHLKRIYGKLDVHNRAQAIARARELKLV
jgi:LuxR family maltose regulon positive regulatory protein